MRVAVASDGPTLDSFVSEKTGRAPYFLIIENGQLLKAIKNPFAMGGGGAAYSVAYTLKEEGVNVLYAINFGNNMINALEEQGITYKQVGKQKIRDLF